MFAYLQLYLQVIVFIVDIYIYIYIFADYLHMFVFGVFTVWLVVLFTVLVYLQDYLQCRD